MSTDAQDEKEKLYSLLQLEANARHAETLKELHFLIANETRQIVNYRQAFLFSVSGFSKKTYKVDTASSIAVIDSNEPYIVWLNKIVAKLQQSKNMNNIFKLDFASCPEKYKDEWKEYSLPFVIWVPLQLHDGTMVGGLWIARETPWSDNELVLLKRISDSYAHAMGALGGKKNILRKTDRARYITWAVLLSIFLASFVPIRLSALAPVEIVAKDPVIVSAPIDGVVRELVKNPNIMVEKGETLLFFEDTSFRNAAAIAKKTLSVTEAELRKASQAAFGDNKSKSEIAILRSQVALRQSELDYANDLLSRVEVKAEERGLLIYSDKDDWKGKPVRVGERIMEIADPDKIKLTIELAVSDAILIDDAADVEVFLDISPLNSLPAKITHTSYKANLSANDVLAYKLDAEFVEENSDLRIGLQGTAKIYGEKVTLFFYLFRRPISALRQLIGL
jgi:hypothetical protein